MDLKIENGDFVLDDDGRPVVISGVNELLQRAYIRLTVPVGVPLMPFGCKLPTMADSETRYAESYAVEALRPLPQIVVLGADVETDKIDVSVRCEVDGLEHHIMVPRK